MITRPHLIHMSERGGGSRRLHVSDMVGDYGGFRYSIGINFRDFANFFGVVKVYTREIEL